MKSFDIFHKNIENNETLTWKFVSSDPKFQENLKCRKSWITIINFHIEKSLCSNFPKISSSLPILIVMGSILYPQHVLTSSSFVILFVCVCVPAGPIVMGALLDYGCELWRWSCGKRGSCARYDSEFLSYFLLAETLFISCVVSFLYFLAGLLCHKRGRNQCIIQKSKVCLKEEVNIPPPPEKSC